MRVNSYFCRPYLEDWFFKNPNHARYINKEVVEKYYPVGGVRIEDWFVVPPPPLFPSPIHSFVEQFRYQQIPSREREGIPSPRERY